MTVYIDNKVYDVLEHFYDVSMRLHVTLDYPTVIAKMDRLEQSLYHFANFAEMFHRKPYRRDWQEAGYFDYYVEGFHFAYTVYQLQSGEKVLYYHDVVHDTLNYNPEEGFVGSDL